MVTAYPLILASASPRRRALLAQIGLVPANIVPADINEAPNPKELPRAVVSRLALEKAKAVHQSGQFTLAADTIVCLGRRILDKTEDAGTARQHLLALSGRSHQVITAFCIFDPDGRSVRKSVVSRVTFKRLDAWEVDTYIKSEEWRGKAGSYAIQGLASAFIPKLSGSYSAIVGLPLCEVRNAFIGLGMPITHFGNQNHVP